MNHIEDMTIYSFSPFGYEGALVTVEVDLRRGIPVIEMVGLADGAVRESKERMRAAVQNSGFAFPLERILISLSPADVKKEGAGFDLAIALAVLSAQDEGLHMIPEGAVLVMGELELSGRVRPVRGVFGAVASALELGIRLCIVPRQNAPEAAATGMRVIAAENLRDAYTALEIQEDQNTAKTGEGGMFFPLKESGEDEVQFPPVGVEMEFGEIRGQGELLRALQIAAAGGHNLMAYGPPGCGKTLALTRFPALLPLLTSSEARPVTRIHSLAGNLPHGGSLLRTPPFRAPHQSTSLEGMTGGGPHCGPGEISLAHQGVLFLDEAAEFKVNVLQSLRVSLESGTVVVSRAGRSSTYPACFQLLIAANPCPCGNFGSRGKVCICSMKQVEQYWRKFSAPLLDRIDLRINVLGANSQAAPELLGGGSLTTSELRRDIERAVGSQRRRQGKRNRFLSPEETGRYCTLSPESLSCLDQAGNEYGFSARGRDSCVKLARTIADMAGEDIIRGEHMKEAVGFRKNEGVLGFDF